MRGASGSNPTPFSAWGATNSVSLPVPPPTSRTRLPRRSMTPATTAGSTPSRSRHHIALRLVRLDGRAVGAELDRLLPGVLRLRAHVGRGEGAGLDPLEPGPLQDFLILCFPPSSGNSPPPEVAV